jgi:hypothetical protein
MIAELMDTLFERVELTECRQVHHDCVPEFDMHAIEVLLISSIMIALLAWTISANQSIASTMARGSKRTLWTTTIWIAAVVGAIVWFIFARRLLTTSRPEAPDISTDTPEDTPR